MAYRAPRGAHALRTPRRRQHGRTGRSASRSKRNLNRFVAVSIEACAKSRRGSSTTACGQDFVVASAGRESRRGLGAAPPAVPHAARRGSRDAGAQLAVHRLFNARPRNLANARRLACFCHRKEFPGCALTPVKRGITGLCPSHCWLIGAERGSNGYARLQPRCWPAISPMRSTRVQSFLVDLRRFRRAIHQSGFVSEARSRVHEGGMARKFATWNTGCAPGRLACTSPSGIPTVADAEWTRCSVPLLRRANAPPSHQVA